MIESWIHSTCEHVVLSVHTKHETGMRGRSGACAAARRRPNYRLGLDGSSKKQTHETHRQSRGRRRGAGAAERALVCRAAQPAAGADIESPSQGAALGPVSAQRRSPRGGECEYISHARTLLSSSKIGFHTHLNDGESLLAWCDPRSLRRDNFFVNGTRLIFQIKNSEICAVDDVRDAVGCFESIFLLYLPRDRTYTRAHTHTHNICLEREWVSLSRKDEVAEHWTFILRRAL